jgi:hypothetical protein
MAKKDKVLAQLRKALGHRPLTRPWAAAEMLVGLAAVGLGILLDLWVVGRQGEATSTWSGAAAALVLFVCGGYLALAGHRSHLFQSHHELADYLAQEIRSLKEAQR